MKGVLAINKPIMPVKAKRRKNTVLFLLIFFCLLLVPMLLAISGPEREKQVERTDPPTEETAPTDTLPSFSVPTLPQSEAVRRIMDFAEENGLTLTDYSSSLISLLEKHPEAEEFVLHYLLEYGKEAPVDLSEYEDSDTVPLFLQWDTRWGYMEYGDDAAGLTACGPLCLSMVAYYYTKDPAMSPDNIIRFARDNGYYEMGSGSYWSLISEGGETLGLDVTAITSEKGRVIANLEAGNLIICVMGRGDFTTDGHFIVLTGCENGLIQVNDPNSPANSEKLWDFDAIKDQILAIWAIRYPG